MAESKDVDELASTLNSFAIHLLRGMRSIDREAGLTPARLSALSVLVFGGPTALGRLARAEDVASPTMTRIVDGLAELGLVVRTTHAENGRLTIIEPTERGREVMLAAAERRIRSIVSALDSLEPGQRKDLLAARSALSVIPGRIRDQRMR